MIYLLITIVAYCLVTIIFESLPALAQKEDKKEWLKTSIICNVITNPILNTIVLIILPEIDSESAFLAIVFALEIVIFLFEGYIYKKRMHKPLKKCMAYSFLANFISVLSGVLAFVIHNLIVPITSSFDYSATSFFYSSAMDTVL